MSSRRVEEFDLTSTASEFGVCPLRGEDDEDKPVQGPDDRAPITEHRTRARPVRCLGAAVSRISALQSDEMLEGH